MTMTRSWLDDPPPADPSLAKAYWCDMDYFLAHTATGEHPECRCPEGVGHNDPALASKDLHSRKEGQK